MFLNPPKFNKLHWAFKFNRSMAITILRKRLQFLRDGWYSWEFNRNSRFCSHDSGQYLLPLLIMMLSVRMLPVFRFTVRLNQLMDSDDYGIFAFGRWGGTILLFEKVISNISQGRVITVPLLYVFYFKNMQKKQSKCILTVVHSDRIDWQHESNCDKLLSHELSIIV